MSLGVTPRPICQVTRSRNLLFIDLTLGPSRAAASELDLGRQNALVFVSGLISTRHSSSPVSVGKKLTRPAEFPFLHNPY